MQLYCVINYREIKILSEKKALWNSREISCLSSPFKVYMLKYRCHRCLTQINWYCANKVSRQTSNIKSIATTNALNHETQLLLRRSEEFRPQSTTNISTINISETRIKCIFGRGQKTGYMGPVEARRNLICATIPSLNFRHPKFRDAQKRANTQIGDSPFPWMILNTSQTIRILRR